MRTKRKIELGLAGVISITAAYLSFVPMTSANYLSDNMQEMIMAPFRQNPEAMMINARPEIAEALRDIQPTSRLNDRAGDYASYDESAFRITSEDIDIRFSPEFVRESTDTSTQRRLGISFEAEPLNDDRRWWLMGGVEHETYIAVPTDGFRDLSLSQVGGTSSIGDAHAGIAFELNDDMYASVGYVRQKREFNLGRDSWEEEDHFIGASFRARW